MQEARLDEVDLRLLAALQRNARSTFAELATEANLGAPAVHDRVRRLEQRGYLRGYAALLDTRLLGLTLNAFISIYTTPDVRYEAFCSAVSALPEVCEVDSVAGEESYILRVVTRSTDHLDDFLGRLKSIAGIARTKTTIVLSSPFRRDGVAVEALISEAPLSSARSAGSA